MSICLQSKVLEGAEVTLLKEWLENIPRKKFFFEQSNGRWGLQKVQPLSHRFIDPHDSWFPVCFDNDGQVLSESITIPFENYPEFDTLKKIVVVALSVMAKHGNFQSQNCQMAMSVMQHHCLKNGETTKAIPWHRDASDYTFVILLDDEKQWTGGNFLFKNRDGKISSFAPKIGQGIFFSNDGTKHSVEPLTAVNEGMSRTILSLHQKNFI